MQTDTCTLLPDQLPFKERGVGGAHALWRAHACAGAGEKSEENSSKFIITLEFEDRKEAMDGSVRRRLPSDELQPFASAAVRRGSAWLLLPLQPCTVWIRKHTSGVGAWSSTAPLPRLSRGGKRERQREEGDVEVAPLRQDCESEGGKR
ncbi:hypothetical protein FQA47_010660 [Oryzias melastigma]|uniref:Uncharacterized protein n=1 Tax=Oryzias melastigma TaxID=30732 RepID=A0A834BYN9_ORYME|nr:hypothetical protein FQA47_010660 [Oryzias melastigma]